MLAFRIAKVLIRDELATANINCISERIKHPGEDMRSFIAH